VGGAIGGVDNAQCGVGTPFGVYSGLIDNVAVWNTALSAAQVSVAFQNPANPFAAAVPEPAAYGLMTFGLGVVFGLRRRRSA
jgi:hypothetical protein